MLLLMKKPQAAKYDSVWDVDTVLSYGKSKENASLSLCALASELETLLAPANLFRASDLASIEFSKSKVSFLPALVSAVMRSSFFKSTEVFRMSKGISLLNFVTFRRWAPLLHRYFTEVDVAACQILIFLIQDFLSSSHQKYPKVYLIN
ncbi:hypothetical protein DAPPUDRAFT_260037 [Daphnia pulex]|uniref:Uncharacterized protein n=1 Tax=Daphnia pulex TaxID=6669 RepID=E9HID1_DAPPU|nr:hypothetical protein DAPPUDRAFT_260037 [Daphnia pulex]|eukprot:EFX68479.1 hypothetical protein DAPPUDRAFT_260037 [Daphnia pulex]